MTVVRETRIDIDKQIVNNPAMDRIRDELRQVAMESHREMESNPVPDEDEGFVPNNQRFNRKREQSMPQEQRTGRGPLRNQDELARMRAIEEVQEDEEIEMPERLRRNRRPISNRPTDDEDMPPPPNRQAGEVPRRRELITNRSPEASVNKDAPPTPSQMQLLNKRIEDLQEQLREVQKAKGVTVPGDVFPTPLRLAINSPSRRNPNMQRVDLPSGFVFYPFTSDQFGIRRINILDQIKLTNAKKTRNLALLIDTLNDTITEGINIRDLTVADFFYVLYWHKFNSYSKIPLTVEWRSKYGNLNTYTIEETKIEYIAPKLTREEYVDKYYSKGLCLPTVREWEVFELRELNDDELTIFERAQYFQGKPGPDGIVTLQSKVDGMIEASGDDLELQQLIPDMVTESVHGIKDTIELSDAKFDAEQWITDLRYRATLAQADAENYREDDFLTFAQLSSEANDLLSQVTALEKTLAEGGQVEPDLETVPVRINPLDFFPSI